MMGKMILGIFLLFLAGMAFALPDYRIMASFNSSWTNESGSFIKFNIITYNNGDAATNNSASNATYMFYNDVWTVAPLGQYFSQPHQSTFPCTPGQNVIMYARADVYNAIPESNESNNVGWGSGQCQGQGGQPDLRISGLNVPTTMIVGRIYTGTVTTHNAGTGAAGSSTTNVQANGQYVANIQVPQLAAGASSTGSFRIQCSSVGRRQVIARADSTGMVSESNENNNVRTATVNCISNPTAINNTNGTINVTSVGGTGSAGSKNPYMGILNALGISFSDELLNAICMGR